MWGLAQVVAHQRAEYLGRSHILVQADILPDLEVQPQ
jgi:hypothetical protein